MDTPLAFIAFSSALTGFTQFELYGTGVADSYYQALLDIIGPAPTQHLLDTYEQVVQQARAEGATPDLLLRQRILSDPTYGPVARNLIRLWYTGSWAQLPEPCRSRLGALPNDYTRVLSTEAYIEGLVWKAMNAHPMGAKQMGYGSWALPPSR